MILSPLLLLALAASGVAAGTLGALIGVGGGILLIPILTFGFGVDLRIATATSLVAVVANSTATGSVNVGSGLANMRLGMTLEIATSIGGVTGGLVAAIIPVAVLARVFALVLVITAALMLRNKKDGRAKPPAGDASSASPSQPQSQSQSQFPSPSPSLGERNVGEQIGTLAGAYYDEHAKEIVHYQPVRVLFGSAVALLAGVISGLLGVGGGFLKVPAMNLGMRVPLRVAAATSNFMIGVTATSSLFVYFARGDVQPLLAAPIALGVVGGSVAGVRIAKVASPRALRWVMAIVLLAVAVQLIMKGAR